MVFRSVRASNLERTKPLPGDEVIPQTIGSLTQVLSPRRLAVAGPRWGPAAGRDGTATTFLDNGRRRSAERVVPELQRIAIGTLFPAVPGATDGFVVVRFEPERFLVLGWPAPDGSYLTTWAFLLEETAPDCTRLIARSCAASGYPFFGLPPSLGMPVVRLVHFIMQRKQLLGIAKRVEQRSAGCDRPTPPIAVPK